MPLNQHLRALWRELGYPDGMGSAAVASPPPKGIRRLYHLTSAEYAVSAIVFNRLKVARFSDLNDPFELSLLDSNNVHAREVIAAHKAQLDTNSGLLCFSADWTDPVLWTHYGSKHRGICLGFDVDEKITKPVSYQSTRLNDEAWQVTPAIDDVLSDKVLHTKFESWRYENEWRVLIDLDNTLQEGSLHFHQFGKQLRLTEVILGSFCDLSLSTVRELVAAHHPRAVTIKARMAFKFFKIVPKESTVPLVRRESVSAESS
jgi:hypothetical protein